MARENIPALLGNVSTVKDLDEGKRVTLEIRQPDISDLDVAKRLRRTRARARALAAAGFLPNGFLFKPDVGARLPNMDRRTEILSENKVSDDMYSYDILVKPGPVLK